MAAAPARLVIATSLSSARLGAAVADIDWRRARRPARRSLARAGHDQRGGGVEQHDVAQRAGLAPQQCL